MREIIIYSIVAVSSLTMIAYSVRMFIGGLVSAQTEYTVMAIVTVIVATVLGFLAWDIVKRRREADDGSSDDSGQN